MKKSKNFKVFQMMEIAKEMKADGYTCEFRTDYSGRGMFGKTCVGFVVDDTFELQDRLFMRNIRTKPKQDDMGLSKIVYFPTIQL